MKKIFIYTTMVLAIALSSCKKDMIDVKPTDKINAGDVFSSEEGLDVFRTGMYANIANGDGTLYSTQLPIQGGILGDDMVYGNAWYKMFSSEYSFKQAPTNAGNKLLWTKLYYFTEICNTLVSADIKNVDPDKVKQFKAEARALRAMAYVDVARFFGKAYHLDGGASKALPYVDYVDYEAKPSRNTMKEIYEKAINDLTIALPDLAKLKGSELYMNQTAVKAVLARIYMDMAGPAFGSDANLVKARSYAKDAYDDITLIGTTELVNGLSNINSETILAIGQMLPDLEKWRDFHSFHDDLDGMGEDFLVNKTIFNSFASTDIRKAFFIREPHYYKYYNQGVYSVDKLASSAFLNRKGYTLYGKFPRLDVQVPGVRGSLGLGHYNYIRGTEMALIVAECDARIGDNNAEAQTLLLEIQKRADATAVVSVNTGANLVDEIVMEARKELLGEGHDRRNIQRLGVTLTRTGTHWALKGINIPAGDARWQYLVPEKEMTSNPNLAD